MKPVVKGRLDVAARTHTGRVRSHNEDTFLSDPARGVFAVIDGMGGERAGEVAAEITREVLGGAVDLQQGIHEANQRVRAWAETHPDTRGMGCVVTAARVEGSVVQLAHVGDTRAYVASAAGVEQLTRDHTAVADAQAEFGLSEAEAVTLADQHAVTRDVGGADRANPEWIDLTEAPFEGGDLLLLCSDGLHDMVPGAEIARRLARAREEGTPAVALCTSLLDTALERGGRDNVTVVIVRRLAGPGPVAALVRRFAPHALVIGAVVLAFVVGRQVGSRYDRVALAGLAGSTGFVGAGPARLDGTWVAGPRHAAGGPLVVEAATSTSRIPAGAEVVVHGAELSFPEGPARWTLDVGDGASLVLRQVSLRAPQLVLAVHLGAGASVSLRDSTVEARAIEVEGAEDALFGGEGGSLVLVEGAPALTPGGGFTLWPARVVGDEEGG